LAGGSGDDRSSDEDGDCGRLWFLVFALFPLVIGVTGAGLGEAEAEGTGGGLVSTLDSFLSSISFSFFGAG